MDGGRGKVRAVLGILLGVLSCAVAVIFAREAVEFMRSSVIAPAQVVRLTYGSHHADAVFRAGNGEQVELPVSTFGAMHVGDQVDVRYDPRNPQAGARLNSFLSMWMVQLLFGAVGLVSIFSGIRQLGYRLASSNAPQKSTGD
jgi:hypothetical protein